MAGESYETLVVERRGPVGWLIFNRPEALNAMNITMGRELGRAWRELDADDEVKVIVNAGRGRAFQSGVDVKEVAAAGGMGGRNAQARAEGAQERSGPGMTAHNNNVWKPVICAVNGVCAGAGFHFVVDADFVVASTAASFVDPHVSVGQVTALEPIGLLGRIPFGTIMRMVLMGRFERFDAARAYELGLVTQVIEAERFEEECQALAETIARNSPTCMMLSKKAVWNGLEVGREAALAEGMRLLSSFYDHPDNAEGARAFAEKRDPHWEPLTR
jgi:enoyl-CoA hydratase/carnithine racemase